jgi:hypothetical protein
MQILAAALGTVLLLTLGMARGAERETAVSSSPAEWTIRGSGRVVTINRTNLAITVKSGTAHWETLGSGSDDVTLEINGERFARALSGATNLEFKPFASGYADGLRIRLAGFQRPGKEVNVALALSVALEHDTGEVICEATVTEGEKRVKELLWPRGFSSAKIDQTVVPFMQGMLLPKDWPRKVFLYDTLSYGRGLYMPWWGQQQGESAALVILETLEDGGCRFEHPEGGPTRIEPRWVHSLGHFSSARRLRFCFFDRGNYVEMAARYRRHVMGNGKLVTLKEKFARNPIAAGLVGTPVVHTGILNHIQPESSYYKKDDPAANHQLTTFDQRADDLRQLREAGVRRAYVHLDGWGQRGYDNLHPDILPPGPDAGGWDGLRRFADTCESLGYLFAVHDQYRDFYHDAASYSEALTVIQEDGSRPFGQVWWGGKQSILCSKFAPGYVARNHRRILAEGVKLRGAYLDVFAVVPGDECYSPDHPVTRAESLKYRGECFNLIRDLEGIVSSEEPADWAMRYLHLVHHAPFALDPDPGRGPGMGVPIPLHSLVYHDALVVPWSLTKGGWGIPDADLGYLHALANAGVPYVSFKPDAAHLEQVRTVCALHRRLALVPMVRHEFLDQKYRRQKTSFQDGTTVEVDFETGKHIITPALTTIELGTMTEPLPGR